MNYYISDTHFGYQKIAEQSGFTDTDAYNESVIRRINQRVADEDTLFLLGDLSCYQQDPSEFIKRLNGRKILITGNHDARWIKHRHVRKLFREIHPYLLVKDAGTKIFLCHYPMAEWDGTFKGYWHFYGHIHNEKGIGAERIMRYVPRAVNVSIQKIGEPKTAEELFAIRKRGGADMSSENELGKFVREKRTEKGLSQRELAYAAGISNAEISRLEAGKRKASSPAVLKAIAKALNVPVEVLLEKSGIIEEGKRAVDKTLGEIGDMPLPQAGQSSIQQKRSIEEQTFISVDDLTDDEIADIMRYIEFIKSKRDS